MGTALCSTQSCLAAVYIELTGGAQAGLDFNDSAGQAAQSGGVRKAAKQRPQPLKSLITDEEAAAHDAFIAELGPESVWATKAG